MFYGVAETLGCSYKAKQSLQQQVSFCSVRETKQFLPYNSSSLALWKPVRHGV